MSRNKKVGVHNIPDRDHVYWPPTHWRCSLVPRPFPPPVFDSILYVKTEGEGLGERVTCMMSGWREGRHKGAVTDCCNPQTLHRVYQTTNCIDTVFWMLQFQVLGQNITRRTSRFFIRHRPPSCLPSRLPDVTHVTLSPRSSPSIFAYSMRSKAGGGNGLGTRLLKVSGLEVSNSFLLITPFHTRLDSGLGVAGIYPRGCHDVVFLNEILKWVMAQPPV